jgi:glycine cleavage system transcriptional repressor
MKQLVALSAIGQDQPGIVAALSKVLFEKNCNLEDSSMTRLNDDFAVLLLVALPDGLEMESLRNAMKKVTAGLGLTLSLRELSSTPNGSVSMNSLAYTLVVYGIDHPGIVYQISQCAADYKVNIVDLRTHVTNTSDSSLYSMVMELEIPNATVVGHFLEKLNLLKKELKVDLTLNPSETDEL